MDHQPNHVWLPGDAALDDSELVIVARSMIAARIALHKTLPSELIHDTALDILLNLFVAYYCCEAISINGIVQRTSVPQKTVIRWIEALGQYGLVMKKQQDCELTETGVRSVRSTLINVSMSQWQFAE